MATNFANYHSERLAFKSLFAENCAAPILLIKGESGSGKTSLMTTCLNDAPKHIRPINIQLRGSAVGVAEIFSRTAISLGWENLPNFSRCMNNIAGNSANVSLNNVTQTGQTNLLRIALNVDNITDREHRQTELTDAWFDDIRTLNKDQVLVFDTYEQAPNEVRDWLSGPFLARISLNENIRVAIAGQTVPVVSIDWNQYYRQFELFGVSEAKEWLPVVEGLNRFIPSKSPEEWLAGICYYLRGQPAAIMKVIESLPKKANNSEFQVMA